MGDQYRRHNSLQISDEAWQEKSERSKKKPKENHPWKKPFSPRQAAKERARKNEMMIFGIN
jgi:hypothetical protein